MGSLLAYRRGREIPAIIQDKADSTRISSDHRSIRGIAALILAEGGILLGAPTNK